MNNLVGDGWRSTTVEECLCEEFQISKEQLEGCKILYANYSMGDYEGSALVVFEKDGTLYEVNGGHCSCYGLEGQWEPEETTKESLLSRPSFYMSDYNSKQVVEDIKEALKDL